MKADFTLAEIIRSTGGELIFGGPRKKIKGISVDSRTLRPGEAFFAIRGERFDGADFIEKAVKKGASVVLVNHRHARALKRRFASRCRLPAEFACVSVDETTNALGEIASFHRRRCSPQVIAVTGSSGKTTTKDMLASILGGKYSVLKNRGTENNNIGLPLTLLKLKKKHRYAVLEMGMNHPGEIDYLSRIARPETALITNIGPAHIGFMGNMRETARAKLEVAGNLAGEKTLVINGDDSLLRRSVRRFKAKVVFFGIKRKDSHIHASRICWLKGRGSFLVNGTYPLRLRLPGEHSIYNALAAWAAARHLGIEPDFIRERLEKFKSTPGRFEIKKVGRFTLIDDTYNSNPYSLRAALAALGRLPGRRKIFVMGDMLELGKWSVPLHRSAAALIEESRVDCLITLGKYTKFTHAACRKRSRKIGCLRHCASKNEVVKILRDIAGSGDTILIKASHRIHLDDIVKSIKSVRFGSART